MLQLPKRHPSPYHHDLDTRLLQFGRRDYLTTRDLVRGVLITGSTGSGKSSTSGKALLDSCLHAGFGGLLLTTKAEDADIYEKAAKRAGRKADFIRFDASGEHRFNPFAYAAATFGRELEQNVTELIRVFAEGLGSVSASGSGSNDNGFFMDAGLRFMSAAIGFLIASQDQLRLKDVQTMLLSAPRNKEELEAEEWRASSFCWKVLEDTAKLAELGHRRAMQAIDDYGDFWTQELVQLGNSKTRTSIESTIQNILSKLTTGPFAHIFGTDCTLVPEMMREGKIICLDWPILKYGPAAAGIQMVIKQLVGMSARRYQVKPKDRPVAIYIDEYQYTAHAGDAELLSTARSHKLACIMITQDFASLNAALGAGEQDLAESLKSKFGHVILHANSHHTNAIAADMIGKTLQHNESETTSYGRNSGGSLNQHEQSGSAGAGSGRNTSRSHTVSSYLDHVIRPEYFAQSLRTGGKQNRRKADAIIVKAGGVFKSTKTHWMKLEMKQ